MTNEIREVSRSGGRGRIVPDLVERGRSSTKSNVPIRGRRDSRVASVTGWKATSLLLLINVNAARFDGGAPSRKTRRRAANQTVRNGAKVQFGLLVGSSESGGHAIGRLFARESILRFRGMPRLCNEGEEQRTSGAERLRLDGSAWCYRVIGPGWNSGSSNVTAKDKPFSDARCTSASDTTKTDSVKWDECPTLRLTR
ncbi:hypothetical protein K0M31_014007 [Melipona bicolor]|uniref:Uncharacterized protein n=1 Tax=Melipona bicolor TaxID=60889 RepID=A0AA40G7N7_9HYME|nr:hypothetical protein K0M31_014007 [Melipona bicolor]